MPPFAVGMLIKDRWEQTKLALTSLFYCDQPKDSFDLFLIDNGSSEKNVEHIKKYVQSGLLPVKHLITLPDTSLSKAFNFFMAVTQKYEYRVKYDNDLTISGTIRAMEPKPARKVANPLDYGVNPGAIPSKPSIGGGGMKRRSQEAASSCFLDGMMNFSKTNNADLVSLLPVTAGVNPNLLFNEVVRKKINGYNYLIGGCMMISKKCFDTIGYFDERLSRKVDVDYSQRAIKGGLNIGYDQSVCVIHNDVKPSEEQSIFDLRVTESLTAIKSGQVAGYCPSIWHENTPRLIRALKRGVIITAK